MTPPRTEPQLPTQLLRRGGPDLASRALEALPCPAPQCAAALVKLLFCSSLAWPASALGPLSLSSPASQRSWSPRQTLPRAPALALCCLPAVWSPVGHTPLGLSFPPTLVRSLFWGRGGRVGANK